MGIFVYLEAKIIMAVLSSFHVQELAHSIALIREN